MRSLRALRETYGGLKVFNRRPKVTYEDLMKPIRPKETCRQLLGSFREQWGPIGALRESMEDSEQLVTYEELKNLQGFTGPLRDLWDLGV